MNFDAGFLLIDKSSGPTSHDAVLWARRVLKTGRVGHCGTLDPMARGLLVLGVGSALKCQSQLMAERKTYTGRMRLGISTDTDDITGQVIQERACSLIPLEILKQTVSRFCGAQRQQVPRYSAVKIEGRPLYEWARLGREMSLPFKDIEVYQFELVSYQHPDIEFFVECSKGTYIRSLVRDVGEALRTAATLTELCRESIGHFTRKNAYPWVDRQEPDFLKLQKSFNPV